MSTGEAPLVRPAVFLDRDGTLVEEVHFLHRPEQLRLLPGAAEAMAALAGAGFALVVVTNQSGIGRGYFSEEDLARVHRALEGMLADRGVHLDGLYYCPHAPDEGCGCRKPGTALYQRACRDLGLEPARSYAVGDRISDVSGAARLGCTPLLVRTGYGREQAKGLPADTPIRVVDDLAAAARKILGGGHLRAR